MPDISICNKKHVYKGYNQYNIYDFEVPSFKHDTQSLSLINREVLETKDAVHVLIYTSDTDSFVFCQQFRCGTYLNDAGDDPFLLECIAGTIEPGTTAEETVIREVKEESGLTVDSLQPIISGYSSPGIMNEKSYLYYATVIEKPKPFIGGVESEDEEILTHVIDRRTVYQMMDENRFQDCKTMLALYWFRCIDQNK